MGSGIQYSQIKRIFLKVALVVALFSLLLQITIILSNNVQAEAASTINFQGKIVNLSDGTNLVNGSPSCVVAGADTCDIRASLYSAPTGGTLLWQETHSNVELGDANGIFNLSLNSVCNDWLGGCAGSGVSWSNALPKYLQLEFDTDGNGDFSSAETFSRKLLQSVPYAYYADEAGTLEGLTKDEFIQFMPAIVQSSGLASDPLIWLNEDGAGVVNLIEIEVGGTDKFVVNNDGRIGVAGATTLNAYLNLPAATTGAAQINLASSTGTDPSAPNNGDLWWNGTNLYFYDGATTQDLLAGGAELFTDGGAITYLTSTTDDLAIGATNSLTAPFSVDVSENTVRIGTGSTANAVLNMYASDGDTGSITYNTSDQWAFTGGDINLTGSQDITYTTSDVGFAYAFHVANNPTTTTSGTNHSKGILVQETPVINTGQTNSGASMAAHLQNLKASAQTGTLAAQYGLYVQYGSLTGAGGTTTDAYGVRIQPYHEAGTITNSYALYIDAPSAGGTVTNQYAIYQANTSGLNYFGGNVAIGAAPASSASLVLAAATTTEASLRINSSAGTNVSTPVSGDLWWNGTALNFYNGSTTINLLASGGITSLNGLTGTSQTFVNDTNVTITSAGTTHTLGWSGQLSLARGGTGANLTDPNADRIVFWDDSAGGVTWLAPGTGLSISGTTLSSTVTNLFTDAGTVTYLTSTTDDFAIGGTTLAASFSVDESANTVRIGEGSGSNAVLSMYASDADTGSITYSTNDYFQVTGGGFRVDNGLAVNTDPDLANYSVYVARSGQSGTINDGIRVTNSISTANASSPGVTGIYSSVSNSIATGTTANIQSFYAEARNDGGSVTYLSGLATIARITGSAGATHVSGVRITSNIDSSTGSIINSYGLLIEDQTAGSNDYGIYIQGSDTYALWVDNDDAKFDNNVIIGGNTSSAETLSNASFVVDGNDLFVAGTAGIEGDIFTDAGIVVGNSALTAVGTIESDGTDVFAYRSDKAVSLTEGFLYDKHRQDISTNNTKQDQVVRKGWGYSIGTLSGTTTVNFGVTFEEVPIMSFDVVGSAASAPTTLDQCTGDGTFNMSLSGITSSNFDYYRNVGSTTVAYCYSWIAIGEYTTDYGADLAENYLTFDRELVPGNVIAIDDEHDIAVERSNGKGDKKIFGVATTAPGIVLGNGDGTSNDYGTYASILSKEENKKLIENKEATVVAVALEGRVPVKVTLENGPIKKGDYLTASSKPGYAMKATEPGNIIGRALEDFNEITPGLITVGDEEFDIIMNAVKEGKTEKLKDLVKYDGNNGEGQIMVLVEKGFFEGEADNALSVRTSRLETLKSNVNIIYILLTITLILIGLIVNIHTNKKIKEVQSTAFRYIIKSQDNLTSK